jgi:hypothetical protein
MRLGHCVAGPRTCTKWPGSHLCRIAASPPCWHPLTTRECPRQLVAEYCHQSATLSTLLSAAKVVLSVQLVTRCSHLHRNKRPSESAGGKWLEWLPSYACHGLVDGQNPHLDSFNGLKTGRIPERGCGVGMSAYQDKHRQRKPSVPSSPPEVCRGHVQYLPFASPASPDV